MDANSSFIKKLMYLKEQNQLLCTLEKIHLRQTTIWMFKNLIEPVHKQLSPIPKKTVEGILAIITKC